MSGYAQRMCQAAGVLGLAIACAVSAAAWVYLVAAHGGFWRTGQRLPPRPRKATSTAGHDQWPAVVAVVPARNEADSLPGTLPALLAQEYPGEFRVFLVDDGSDDGTADVAAELGEKAARDGGAPLTVVPGRPRPDGWAGKVWAMAQGLAAAVDTGSAARTGSSAATGLPAGRVGKRSGSGRRPRLRAVHRRGHRLGADRAARPGPGGGRRRPRPGLPDGPAPRGDGLGTGDRARVRVLLRPALSVQEGQRPEEPHLGRGRRLHADPDRGAGTGGRPRADAGRADRRRGPRHAAEEERQPHLARPHHRHQVRPAVPEPGQPLAHDRQVRLRPAPVQPGPAGGHPRRPAAALRGAARRRDRRADRGRPSARPGPRWPSPGSPACSAGR